MFRVPVFRGVPVFLVLVHAELTRTERVEMEKNSSAFCS